MKIVIVYVVVYLKIVISVQCASIWSGFVSTLFMPVQRMLSKSGYTIGGGDGEGPRALGTRSGAYHSGGWWGGATGHGLGSGLVICLCVCLSWRCSLYFDNCLIISAPRPSKTCVCHGLQDMCLNVRFKLAALPSER